jgi:hypothetical protein
MDVLFRIRFIPLVLGLATLVAVAGLKFGFYIYPNFNIIKFGIILTVAGFIFMRLMQNIRKNGKMEIRYLKNLARTPIIDRVKNEGISEEEIDNLEIKIGRKFPQAYREFLYLAGEYSGFYGNGNYWRFSKLQRMQDDVKRELALENFTMEKDFWAFITFDGGEQFTCFYWDEGDNPAVYNVIIWDDELEIECMGTTFTKYVDRILSVSNSTNIFFV